MITSKHLKIYAFYEGDGDMLSRSGSKKEKETMNYETWKLIDDLLETLEIVEKGLASKNFELGVLEKLQKSCDSETTQKELRKLIGKY